MHANDPTQAPLSNTEIVAHTFQAIRVRELKRVSQVKEVMAELFPEIDEVRRQQCLVELANVLCSANAEVLSPAQRQRLPRR